MFKCTSYISALAANLCKFSFKNNDSTFSCIPQTATDNPHCSICLRHPVSSNFPNLVSMSSSFSTTSLPPPSTPPHTNHSNQCLMENQNLRLPLAVVYSLFFLFGLVGNLVALWMFFFLRSSNNSVRLFLINCAVADLVLLACLPFRIFYHLKGNQWLLGSLACKMVGNLFYMNMYISIMLLGFISLHRYLRLKVKGKSRQGMTVKLLGHRYPWSWVACGTLWSLSVIMMVPMIVTAEDEEESGKCFQFKPRSGNAKGKAIFNIFLVAFFWLVFIMLMVSYVKIASKLLRVSREKPDLPNARRYQQSARKSLFILFLFIVCFGPYHTFRPIYIFYQINDNQPCDILQMVDRTNELVLLLSAFNSCLDPFMYFLLSGSVRKSTFRIPRHRLSTRQLFLQDGTSNSSTIEYRRSCVPVVLANPPPCHPQNKHLQQLHPSKHNPDNTSTYEPTVIK